MFAGTLTSWPCTKICRRSWWWRFADIDRCAGRPIAWGRCWRNVYSGHHGGGAVWMPGNVVASSPDPLDVLALAAHDRPAWRARTRKPIPSRNETPERTSNTVETVPERPSEVAAPGDGISFRTPPTRR